MKGAVEYPVFKGLQKPLVYRGFKGRFIGYGVGCLVAGLVSGGTLGALTNMVTGALVMGVVIAGGLWWTSLQQRKGLHNKTRHRGVFVHPARLRLRYGGTET